MKLFTINKKVLFYRQYASNVNTGIIYRQIGSSLLKGLRRLHLKSGLPWFCIWYTKEFRQTASSDEDVILFDSLLTIPAANYLRKKNHKKRIIYWFWNHVYDVNQPEKLLQGIELWSYDKEDCQKFGFQYNTQFYFPELAKKDNVNLVEQDFFFIGAEKGRGELINNCRHFIESSGYTYKIIVTNAPNSKTKESRLSYEEVLLNISQSKCVIDILPLSQKGLSLRPLEALYHRKKLITNLHEIVNYDFYHSSNIYVLGKESRTLDSFLKEPYQDIPKDVVDKYSFKEWIKRF